MGTKWDFPRSPVVNSALGLDSMELLIFHARFSEDVPLMSGAHGSRTEEVYVVCGVRKEVMVLTIGLQNSKLPRNGFFNILLVFSIT